LLNQNRRGSSADWSRDRLRAKEIEEYKSKSGQTAIAKGVYEPA
jgi:hypothetical protein